MTPEIEVTVKGIASIFPVFFYQKAKSAHLRTWSSFILKAAPVWGGEPVFGDVITQPGMWGGFSSFSACEQRWQKALRAPCADAAGAVALEKSTWGELTSVRASADSQHRDLLGCAAFKQLHFRISQKLCEGWEAEGPSCS